MTKAEKTLDESAKVLKQAEQIAKAGLEMILPPDCDDLESACHFACGEGPYA